MRTEHIVGDFPPPPEKNIYPGSFVGRMNEKEYAEIVAKKLGLSTLDPRVKLEVKKFRVASKSKQSNYKH